MAKYFFMILLNFSLLSAHSYVVPDGYMSGDIQNAIDTLSRQGGGTVKLLEGLYVIRNAIYLSDNVKLMGSREKTVLKKCPRSSSPIIRAVRAGDREIRVKYLSYFKEGDSITIFSETLNRGKSFVSEIEAITSERMFVKDAIPYDIPLSSKAKIFASFPVIYCKDCQDVAVQNLIINGNSQENPVIDSWWDSGINIRDSSHVKVSDVTVLHSPGDGISLNNAHHVHICNCTVKSSARLGIHIGSGSCYTYLGYSEIVDSGKANIINIDGLYLCHGAAFGFYEKNIIQDTRGAGISIGRWDSGNIFLDNTSCRNEIGILFRSGTFETCSITFLQNTIEGNRYLDFFSMKPIHYIFMDKWPIKHTIHDGSTFLYSYDAKRNEWVHLTP